MELLSGNTKNILGLQLPTDPRWVDLAGISLQEILTDHAYCEQKAAMSCISIIQRYSEKEMLVNELAPVVTEEWGHFRLVLQELHKSGLQLGKQRNDDYLKNFYRRFMESEAGHYAFFIKLAETYIDKEKVRNRWKEWLDYEAKIISELEVRGDRMHGMVEWLN